MQIPYGFDESNAERRKRFFNGHMRTAERLNNRIRHFLRNTNRNYSLTKGQKNTIKNEIIKNL